MKYLIAITSLFLISGRAFSQDFGKIDKFSKKVIKSLEKEKVREKIIMDRETFSEVMNNHYKDVMDDLKNRDEGITVDSLFNLIYAKTEDNYEQVVDRLLEETNDLSDIGFIRAEFDLNRNVPPVINGDITIVFLVNDTLDELGLTIENCMWYDGDWYLGNSMTLSGFNYGWNWDDICNCVRSSTSDTCKVIVEEVSSWYDSLDSDKKAEFEQELERNCDLGKQSNANTSEQTPPPPQAPSYDEATVRTYLVKIDTQFPQLCDCVANYSTGKELSEQCNIAIEEFNQYAQGLDEEEYNKYMYAIRFCGKDGGNSTPE